MERRPNAEQYGNQDYREHLSSEVFILCNKDFYYSKINIKKL